MLCDRARARWKGRSRSRPGVEYPEAEWEWRAGEGEGEGERAADAAAPVEVEPLGVPGLDGGREGARDGAAEGALLFALDAAREAALEEVDAFALLLPATFAAALLFAMSCSCSAGLRNALEFALLEALGGGEVDPLSRGVELAWGGEEALLDDEEEATGGVPAARVALGFCNFGGVAQALGVLSFCDGVAGLDAAAAAAAIFSLSTSSSSSSLLAASASNARRSKLARADRRTKNSVPSATSRWRYSMWASSHARVVRGLRFCPLLLLLPLPLALDVPAGGRLTGNLLLLAKRVALSLIVSPSSSALEVFVRDPKSYVEHQNSLNHRFSLSRLVHPPALCGASSFPSPSKRHANPKFRSNLKDGSLMAETGSSIS